jgi:arsenate reductase
MHTQRWSQDQDMKVQAQSAQGGEPKPVVLFVCVHNAGRSRMAEAFFNQLAGDRYEGRSAGTIPADHPHPEVVIAMKEEGIELDGGPGTMLTQEMTDEAVRVIGMGCAVEEACPALRVPLEDWELDDPKGKSPEEVNAIRDQIEIRVRNLIAQLDRELQD